MNQLPEARPLKDLVRTYLDSGLAEGRASAGDVAKHFRVSERTLRRHLSAQGTSYAELIDATRQELASGWLAAGERPIAEIALTLGFSHVSSFYKAFRRWTGLTPVAYRQQAAAGQVVLQTQPPPELRTETEPSQLSTVWSEAVAPAPPRASGASD